MGEPTTWEEWVAQAPDDAALAELAAAVEEAQRREQEAYATHRAATMATLAAQDAHGRATILHTMVRAAQGYDHIHPRPMGRYHEMVGRRDGMPYVYARWRGWEVAQSSGHVGPGPAVEGRVPGGRRWYALEDLPPWKRVAEWRLAEVSGG